MLLDCESIFGLAMFELLSTTVSNVWDFTLRLCMLWWSSFDSMEYSVAESSVLRGIIFGSGTDSSSKLKSSWDSISRCSAERFWSSCWVFPCLGITSIWISFIGTSSSGSFISFSLGLTCLGLTWNKSNLLLIEHVRTFALINDKFLHRLALLLNVVSWWALQLNDWLNVRLQKLSYCIYDLVRTTLLKLKHVDWNSKNTWMQSRFWG